MFAMAAGVAVPRQICKNTASQRATQWSSSLKRIVHPLRVLTLSPISDAAAGASTYAASHDHGCST
jgi:hypothetical protein